MASNRPTKIRNVWADNLESEFLLISGQLQEYSYVTLDTACPGRSYQVGRSSTPTDIYQILKSNIDASKVVQIGLAFSTADGRLPDLGTGDTDFIWQINLKGFDVMRDRHSPASVKLMRGQGYDFERNMREGVESGILGEALMCSGLLCNQIVTWITFRGAYDFGHLLKISTGQDLPGNVEEFYTLLTAYFGDNFFDVEHVMNHGVGRQLYGELDTVALLLKVQRPSGVPHQTGSNCLLTWTAFRKIIRDRFAGVIPYQFARVFHTLEPGVE